MLNAFNNEASNNDEATEAENPPDPPEDWRPSAERTSSKHENGKRNPVILQQVLDTLPYATLVTDQSQRVVWCNLAACRWFGLGSEQLLGNSITEHLDKTGHQYFFFTQSRSTVVTQMKIAGADGTAVWMQDSTVSEKRARFLDGQNSVQRMEAECLKLARALHDGALQDQIGIGFALAELKRNLASRDPADPNLEALSEVQKDAQRVMGLLRSLVSELRPAGLEEFGIEQALEGLALRLTREHAACAPDLSFDIDELELSLINQVCLFRCAQEALSSSFRHSGAENVLVRIKQIGQSIELSVTDDGRGFTLPQKLETFESSTHSGLAGLAQRVALESGSLQITSSPQAGTTVLLRIPKE